MKTTIQMQKIIDYHLTAENNNFPDVFVCQGICTHPKAQFYRQSTLRFHFSFVLHQAKIMFLNADLHIARQV
jgi:hypothetical protein